MIGILKALNFDLPLTVRRTFEFMEIAEEEIAKAEKRYTRDKVTRACIHDVFGHAQPGQLLRYSDVLYRAHVRELCFRAEHSTFDKAKADMAPATKAEIVAALSEGSLLAPLDQQHAALYEELFCEIFGKYVGKGDERTREPWPGASAELLHTMRQKFRRERRAA